jgi:hypothetical protein
VVNKQSELSKKNSEKPFFFTDSKLLLIVIDKNESMCLDTLNYESLNFLLT